MRSDEIRTRFAPSPSGFLHVGGARTALFNYLYARARGGKFVLRVEDTDQERSSPESEKIILESLKWLGIHEDEGPDAGGPCAPYRQSDRLDVYKKYTDKLIEENLAYRCFCTSEELEAKQQHSRALGVPHVYDGKCRGLSQKEIEAKIKNGEKYAVRFRVNPGEVVVEDLVQGRVKFDSKLIGDFIIVKSDGFPSYNYAVVIDDYEMKITHVVRGVGHLSNTPRQILIHEALDMELPFYAHISEIVGTDSKKLSKRRGATSVLFFKELGYLSQAFVNYMALLGWYPEDANEFMPDGELEKKFDIARCSKSPAMFDFFLSEKGGEAFEPESLSREELTKLINNKSKLNWLNNRYIRALPLDVVWEEAKTFVEKDDSLRSFLKQDPELMKRTFDALRVYLDNLEGLLPYMREFYKEKPVLDDAARAELQKDGARDVIAAFQGGLRESKPEVPDDYKAVMKQAGEKTGAKGKNLFMPIRAASTGSLQGLELPSLFSLLGPERVVARIDAVLEQV